MSPVAQMGPRNLRAAFLVVSCAGIASAQTLVQVIAQAPGLTQLSSLLANNGLDALLSGPGPFTVFGPADTGLLPLGPNVLDFYSNSYNAPANNIVLQYHIVAGAYTTSAFYNSETIATLDSGIPVSISVVGSLISINTARILKANVNASNGFLHIIDTPLIPYNIVRMPTQDIVTLVSASPSMSSFATAMVSAGLVPSLQCNAQVCNPFTLFVPSNAAFANLPPFFMSYLLERPDQLVQLVNYHIQSLRTYTTQMYNNLQVATLDDFSIVYVQTGSELLVNAVSYVLTSNIQAENGVLHLVDTVLVPNQIRAGFDLWRGIQGEAGVAPWSDMKKWAGSGMKPFSGNANLVEWVQSTPALSTLSAALFFADLVKLLLDGPGPFTLLAPNNDAFKSLPNTFVEYLFAHPSTALTEVVAYHVLPFVLVTSNVTDGASYATVEGLGVTATVVGNETFFNDAQVVSANNVESNGVAHEINAVLLPVLSPTATPSPTPLPTITWAQNSAWRQQY